MERLKIGVIADCFRLPIRESLRKARELGADGVQVYAVAGEICPEAMDRPARREFREFCAGLGLEISALCGDPGGHGFARAEDNPPKIERSRSIVDLAVDLGAPVVTTHIGVVPDDRNAPVYEVLLSACREVAEHAAEAGVVFAVETGPETARVLKAFLDDVGSPGIGANLDPANLVMVTGDDPVRAVHTLKDHIVHTHAKDGVQLKPCDPAEVYNAFAECGAEGFDYGSLFNELPLGEGSVDWDAYLAALREIGFTGYLTIEREAGDNPVSDITHAVAFLRNRMKAGT